jgi:hypothetical protein
VREAQATETVSGELEAPEAHAGRHSQAVQNTLDNFGMMHHFLNG